MTDKSERNVKLQNTIDNFSLLVEEQLAIYNSDDPAEPIAVKEDEFPWNLQRIDIYPEVLKLIVNETEEDVKINGFLSSTINLGSLIVELIDGCYIILGVNREHEKYLRTIKMNFDTKVIKTYFEGPTINEIKMVNEINIRIPKPSDKALIFKRPILVV